MTKTCFQCKLIKNLNEFSYSKTSNTYNSYCKTCNKIRVKKYRENYKYIDIRPVQEQKICKKCNITRNIEEFYFDNNRNNYQSNCKECKREYAKNNKKQRNEVRKKYRNANPEVRIKEALGSRLSSFIKSQIKSNTLLQYVGCSYDYLQSWIEYQLYGDMTIDNYGKRWHIDHCNPCDNYDLSQNEELHKCFNWKNLRPLYREKNYSKSNKVIIEDILLQELKATIYEKNHPLIVQT